MHSVVKSISDDEDEILLGIMNLHNGGRPFAVDPTYSVGGFYRSGRVPQPLLKSDIEPCTPGVEHFDVKHLPYECDSIDSVIFDPPFMFNPHGKAATNRANVRFTMFVTWDDLVTMYRNALGEFQRILVPKGIVAFKCQDYTDSRTTLTHCHVWEWAREQGFYVKDLFVRYRTHGPAYNPALRQKHARKFHSYWLVLEKVRPKMFDWRKWEP